MPNYSKKTSRPTTSEQHLLDLKSRINNELYTIMNAKSIKEIDFQSKYPSIFGEVLNQSTDVNENYNNLEEETNDTAKENNEEEEITENFENDEEQDIKELIERQRKRLKKFNDRAPLKRLTVDERAEDLGKICNILKEKYRSRKWIKKFAENNFLTYSDVFTKRSDLYIQEEVFNVGEKLHIDRLGCKKVKQANGNKLETDNTDDHKIVDENEKVSQETETDGEPSSKKVRSNKEKSKDKIVKTFFDSIFPENNSVLYSREGILKKVHGERIIVGFEGEKEEAIKLRAVRRGEYVISKTELDE